MIDLTKTREQIDEIDRQISELFLQRMIETGHVAEYKIATGKAVYDQKREEEKLSVIEKRANSSFDQRALRELFSQIMSISRKYQYMKISEPDCSKGWEKIKALSYDENTKVVCFGAPGSFTQQAMFSFFSEQVKFECCDNFTGVMQKVQSEEVDFGILPIENSSTGGIHDIYDELLSYDNVIVGEEIVEIKQHLLGNKDSNLSDIKRVYSHPQGLLQCRGFFNENPQLKGIEYTSTAQSAQKVKDDGRLDQAAIASLQAAKEYGLSMIQENIHDEKNNRTRFIIISHKKMYVEQANKLSLCLELPHTSGALYNILSHFIYNDLNLSRIESRPIQDKTWEYRFFIDIEGNLDDAGVQNALFGVKEEATFLRVLGNYQKV